MIGRSWRDESGVALGLAAIVVVLIGVLAAHLLAALRSDLEATTQANRGQRALHLADAGAQAAAAQLRADADPAHYDADDADNSGWAEVLSDGGPPGESLALNGGAAIVTIRYPTPARSAAQQGDGRYAPERVPAGLPDNPGRDFFLAVSEGSFGETRRKVEVILYAEAAGDTREVVQWSWREAYE
jgi:Tfp pilus assembly protein PilV